MGHKNPKIQDRNQNEQPIAEAGALQMLAAGCSACPEPSRGACPLSRRRIFSRRGQQVIEYAVLLTAVSTALLVMYIYSKRGIQSVIRMSAAQMGPQTDAFPVQGRDTEQSNSTQHELTADIKTANATGEERAYTLDSTAAVTGNSVTVSTYQ